MERNVIVLNKMFAGSYLEDSIGHEIINLYKDDEGKNYIYIQPYGDYNACYSGRIKWVVLTRTIEGRYAVEVLARAEIKTDIYNPGNKDQSALCRKVKYGGQTLADIFKDNADNEHQQTSISLEASSVVRPHKKVYLAFGGEEKERILRSAVGSEALIVSMTSNFARSTMKQYFTSDSADFRKLIEMLSDTSLWTIETDKISDTTAIEIREDNFFDICGIDDYELAFSNALAYFMKKYPELVVEFAQKELNATVEPFTNILREHENIDLLLENHQQVVIIENKITSKINGVEVKNNLQVKNQLKKYYDYVEEFAVKDEYKKFKGKKKSYYVLTPNYNLITLEDYDIDGFKSSEKYRILLYSQIYNFLKTKQCDQPYSGDSYFNEFVKGLAKHAREIHNDLFEDTKQRFIKQLKKLGK